MHFKKEALFLLLVLSPFPISPCHASPANGMFEIIVDSITMPEIDASRPFTLRYRVDLRKGGRSRMQSGSVTGLAGESITLNRESARSGHWYGSGGTLSSSILDHGYQLDYGLFDLRIALYEDEESNNEDTLDYEEIINPYFLLNGVESQSYRYTGRSGASLSLTLRWINPPSRQTIDDSFTLSVSSFRRTMPSTLENIKCLIFDSLVSGLTDSEPFLTITPENASQVVYNIPRYLMNGNGLITLKVVLVESGRVYDSTLWQHTETINLYEMLARESSRSFRYSDENGTSSVRLTFTRLFGEDSSSTTPEENSEDESSHDEESPSVAAAPQPPSDSNSPAIQEPAQQDNTLDSLLAQLESPNERDRTSAEYALAERGSEAVEPLIERLHHPSDQVRFSAMRALMLLGQPAVEGLIADLKRNPENRFVATFTLGLMGERAIPYLREALSDPDGRVRFSAVAALSYMREQDSVTALISALRDEEWAVRLRAAQALIQIGYYALSIIERTISETDILDPMNSEFLELIRFVKRRIEHNF